MPAGSTSPDRVGELVKDVPLPTIELETAAVAEPATAAADNRTKTVLLKLPPVWGSVSDDAQVNPLVLTSNAEEVGPMTKFPVRLLATRE